MSCELTIHRTQRITAEALHGVNGSRVVFTYTGLNPRRPDDETIVTVPITGNMAERKAEAWAAAVNMVDEKFHPKRTLADVLAGSIQRTEHA